MSRISRSIIIISATVVALIAAISVVSLAQEEIHLTTIMPHSDVLRGIKGYLGRTWFDPTIMPGTNEVDDGYFCIENSFAEPGGAAAQPGGLRIGDLGAFAAGQPGAITIARTAFNYYPPLLYTPTQVSSGIIGAVGIGSGKIEDYQSGFMMLSHNVRTNINNQPFTFATNGVAALMRFGAIDGPAATEGGHIFQGTENSGAAGAQASLRNIMILRRSRIDLNATNIYLNNTPIHVPSDIRLKQEITTVPNSLERLGSVRGVNFRWKNDKADTDLHTGVIAQEVEKTFPELVYTDAEGVKTVAYEEFTGILVEAIKDLKKENNELRHRLEILKEKGKRLE